MNLPNQLTILRMLLVPVFLLFFYWTAVPYHYIWALAIFIIASLTDFFDGHIARARGLITNFGKLMDPLADKLIVTSALLVLCEKGWVPAWAVMLILAREFLVTAMRTVAIGSGEVIAANIWGKAKTMVQMIWIVFGLVFLCAREYAGAALTGGLVNAGAILFYILMCATLLLTVYSGLQYAFKNKAIFSDF